MAVPTSLYLVEFPTSGQASFISAASEMGRLLHHMIILSGVERRDLQPIHGESPVRISTEMVFQTMSWETCRMILMWASLCIFPMRVARASFFTLG